VRVIVPYVDGGLRDGVIAAVERAGAIPVVIDVGATDFTYGRVLCDEWARGKDFGNVEMDIKVHDDVFKQFDECDCWWGGFPYAINADASSQAIGLGCVRFRRELLIAHPDVMERACKITYAGAPPPGHWIRLDGRVLEVLESLSPPVRCCVHKPPVEHLHDYESPNPFQSTGMRRTRGFRTTWMGDKVDS
jgi:hypothetical protein